ncbi:MAG: LLM class flavin-dependent oxidoreductase [Thermoleophilaceae bacterium]
MRAFAEAITRGDMEAALALCHPEVDFLSMLDVSGRRHYGHEGIRQYFEDVASAWEEWRTEVHRVVEGADGRVAIVMTMHVRGLGSGAVLSEGTAHVWTLKDGLLFHNELYRDPAEALRAVGAEPDEPAVPAVRARTAIFVAPFEELSEPRVLAGLAERAEARGWEGFFVWDHVAYREPVRALADPWVTLAAVATATRRMTIGPLVTPLARRRPHQLARETVTLDRLSGGRLVLGVGLGSDRTGEFEPGRFGEESDGRARARLLDEGLERLARYWDGEFEPRPLQRPRIPVWVASIWPNRRPLRRAARWDGFFPIDLPGPDALAELVAAVEELREPAAGRFEVVVENPPGTDPAPWIEAGATWCLTAFDAQPRRAEVEEAIDAR